MGELHYENSGPVRLSDEQLAHVRAAIAHRLRRNESVALTWRDPAARAEAPETIWIAPSTVLRYVFHSPAPVDLDPHVVSLLVGEAAAPGGIALELEPAPDPEPEASPAGVS